MLSRPEIGTREHVLLWLSSKPADEVFHFSDYDNCACAQYAREHGGRSSWSNKWRPVLWDYDGFDGNSLNAIAGRFTGTRISFGALYEAACKAWGMADGH